MWKRPKRPWTIVLALTLAFAVVIGRGYYRSRMRAAAVQGFVARGVPISWYYDGPRWLKPFFPPDVRPPLHRKVVWYRTLGDDELFDRVVDLLPYVERASAEAPAAVTDATLRRVGHLKRLLHLDLSQTQVTDAGLQPLAGLKRLTWLDLSQTQVTDTGLQHLAGLKRLTWLDLSQTQVTDTGLQHLADLTRLVRLHLSRTQVTDAGLQHLAGLKALQVLDLSQPPVTAAGVAALEDALPKLHVILR